jgi:hypothetical protein
VPCLPTLPPLHAAHDQAAHAAPQSSPSSSNPKSQIQNPQSDHPRRAVPLTFNPIINDEANILAAIARGDRTIPDLAEEHATTITALCLWLQREDIQEKLNALSSCGATLTRVAAVNHLPKAVSALSFQIDGYIFDRTHNLIKPGLDADRIAATRDANVRKAAHLMLRLAKFDPNQPIYRRRKRADRADPSTLAPRIADRANPSTLAPRIADRANPSTLAPQGFAQRGEVASAQHEPVRGVFSNLPHADIVTPDFASDTEHVLPLPSTSPKGEVPAQPGVGAPAFSPGFAPALPTTSSSSLSHIPLPTSDFESDFEPDPESEPVPEPSLVNSS